MVEIRETIVDLKNVDLPGSGDRFYVGRGQNEIRLDPRFGTLASE